LHGHHILDGLEENEINWLSAAVIHEPIATSGTAIVREGELDEALHVIMRGEVVIATAELGDVATLKRGQFFGELSLTGRRHKRASSLYASMDAEDSLLLVTLPVAIVKINPNLAKWVSRLDEVAELEAQRAQGKGMVAAAKGSVVSSSVPSSGRRFLGSASAMTAQPQHLGGLDGGDRPEGSEKVQRRFREDSEKTQRRFREDSEKA